MSFFTDGVLKGLKKNNSRKKKTKKVVRKLSDKRFVKMPGRCGRGGQARDPWGAGESQAPISRAAAVRIRRSEITGKGSSLDTLGRLALSVGHLSSCPFPAVRTQGWIQLQLFLLLLRPQVKPAWEAVRGCLPANRMGKLENKTATEEPPAVLLQQPRARHSLPAPPQTCGTPGALEPGSC